MPRITVLAYDYPPNDGGISRLGAGIVEGFVRCGWTPEAITLKPGGHEGPARPAAAHCEVSRQRGWREAGTLAHLLRTPRVRPIIATAWNPEGSVAALTGRARLTILAHGNELMNYDGRPVKARLRRWVLGRAHCVVCNSAYTQRLVQEIAPDARTVIINPAVDAARFQYGAGQAAARKLFALPEGKRIVLSVSRLDAMKGHETVLKALAGLAPQRRAGLLYVIAGKGAYAETLKEAARRLGVAEQVRFAGFVPEEMLPALYTAADLFALCSVEDRARRAVEGFGMVFSEAQAAGLSVVGTRSGGIPDAVSEGEGGWLVAEEDAAAVRLHLEALADDPSRYREEGERGRARVIRENSWDGYMQKLADVI